MPAGNSDLQPKFGRPEARDVTEFHTNDDTDISQDSHHHTIGPGVNQAASGAHNHDGNNSPRLLEGVTITGSKGGNTAISSIIAALIQLGATDSTT